MPPRRTLVVTGASRGLGAFIAASARAEDFHVIGLARTVDDQAPYEIRPCDVRDETQVKAVFKALQQEEHLYGLVNAAGTASMNLVLTTPFDTMRRIIEVNLLGTMYCSAAIGKLLARRKYGRIINFSTIAVALGLKGEAAYVASKAGVEGFSRAFSREMADFGVSVNVVAPGPIRTDLIKNVPAQQIDGIVSSQIVQRLGTPQDIWNIVRYLLSDEADMISGQVINVGGV